MKVTIQDLATEFGVNKGTISRALNEKHGVGPALRDKILARARSLGFSPNAHARSLATGKTDTIALIFCDETSYFLKNAFYTAVLAGIASEAIQSGFGLAFCSLSVDQYHTGGALPKIMREHGADAYLFVGDQDDSLIRAAHAEEYPLLLVDHMMPGEEFSSVVIDNIQGASRAVEYLISLGHRRIGYVSGAISSPSFQERLAGYQTATHTHDCDADPELVQIGEHGEAGYACMRNLLALEAPPTAIFACNDVNAIQAMKRIHEEGLKVPDNMSVVGFDDSRLATDVWPTLTTMRVDKERMGRLAVQQLLKQLQEPDIRQKQVVVDTELIVRESTAPALEK